MGSARKHALQRAQSFAPFLDRLARRHPVTVECFLSNGSRFALDEIGRDVTGTGSVHRDLRIHRQKLALITALGDLCGELSLADVTSRLSDFADCALDLALVDAVRAVSPEATSAGFTVLALGKHGSRELNYSSDIDLILLYDPDRIARKDRHEPAQAALRIARDMVETIASTDQDGRVFRIDLRLRPTPEVTPIALSIGAAMSHYESQALAWERAAFIRARTVAGDIELGNRFLADIQPFVWRRALDFGQVEEIGRISNRIREHYAQGSVLGPGYDLKRGRGGIREAEFFAQTHQLIHGGRDPALRHAATRPALNALAQAGIIANDTALALADGYEALRTIEHRLQMVDDRQTHSLPASPEAMANVAHLHGLDTADSLVALLSPHTDAIGTVFDALIEPGRSKRLPASPGDLAEAIREFGFEDTQWATRLVEGWRSGRYPSLRSAAARGALESMAYDLVERMGASPRPDAALLKLDAVLAKVPSSLNLFHLLAARPRLLDILSDILSHAPALAHDLAERADLLDGLIQPGVIGARLDRDEIAARLQHATRSGDYGMLLDRVRAIIGEYRFATGATIINGGDPIDAMRDYAHIAEAATQALADAAIREFEAAHGRVEHSELAIVALGRFGGQALTHASDLDVIFLFTGDFGNKSDGARPLGATRYFNRLAQRITAALSVPTASGGLYDVDTRLRPSGNQGPLCVSVDSFFEYQRGNAWTWEHMALTRARTVYGSDKARAAIDQGIRDILKAPRDTGTLLGDARAMRTDIRAHKPPKGPYDAKLIDGGLIDLEFAVHCNQLRHGTALDPDLHKAIEMLVGQGLAPAGIARAHDLLTRMLAMIRLVAPATSEPAIASRELIAAACRCENWQTLVDAYADAREEVGKFWQSTRDEENG